MIRERIKRSSVVVRKSSSKVVQSPISKMYLTIFLFGSLYVSLGAATDFQPRRSEKVFIKFFGEKLKLEIRNFIPFQYPPQKIVELVKPIRDKCIKESGVSEGIPSTFSFIQFGRTNRIDLFSADIDKFSDGSVEDIDENNSHLKCYMYCQIEEFSKDDVSYEVQEIDEIEFFTDEEMEILIAMYERCEEQLNINHPNNCEMAFQMNKCAKLANPEVSPSFYRCICRADLSFYLFSLQYYFLL